MEVIACDAPSQSGETSTGHAQTLFGAQRLPHDRLFHCLGQPHSTQTSSPVDDLLTERIARERLYLEAKLAS